ncbi:hypothetical protein CN220_05015 [Sinorhizobium meliloti]|nr:hypothetical protein CN220_05015 [Sinorhizobium meliloti]
MCAPHPPAGTPAGGAKGQAAHARSLSRCGPQEERGFERVPRGSFAPLAGRRSRQRDEGRRSLIPLQGACSAHRPLP